MKHDFSRRLASLALALVMALSLAVPAWAAPGDPNPAPPSVIEPTSIELSMTEITLAVGQRSTTRLTAKVLPEGADQTVTWSPNTSVASRAGSGVIAARSEGTATFTASVKDSTGKEISASCTVTVIPATPVGGVTLDKQTLDLNVGATETLTATIVPDNATNKAVTWSTGNANVATVTNGVVTAVGAGSTRITVTTEDGGKTDYCEVTVTAIPNSIKLNSDYIVLNAKDTFELIATTVPDNATVRWVSSDRTVATVNPATNSRSTTITTRKAGTTTITATLRTADDKPIVDSNRQPITTTCTVVVTGTSSIRPTGVTLNETAITMAAGGSFKLRATVEPANASVSTVKWTSSAEDVAEVDETGNVTAKKAGTAVITVITDFGNKRATCTVTVAPPATGMSLITKGAENVSIYTTSDNKRALDFNKSDGPTKLVIATPLPAAATDRVRWTSSNPSVATVAPYSSSTTTAQITQVSAGKTTITAVPVYTDANGEEKVRENVKAAELEVTVSGITLTPTTLTMEEYGRDTLQYELFGDAKADGVLTCDWLSSDAAVVAVVSGSVTARKTGSATITATKGSYSATCQVTVVEDLSSIINGGSINAATPYTFDKLLGSLRSVCSSKTGSSLSYITNLSVASTEQGILYDEHHSTADTGAGVGIQDRYYASPNRNQGQRGLSDLSFVPSSTFSGAAEITFTGWSTDNKSFNGLIRFTVNGTGDVMYASNEGAPVAFLADDFNFYHPNLKSVSFTPPQESVGILYYNYTNASQPGTKVTSGTAYGRTSTPSLDRITFVPAVGYQGTARIAYKGTDTSGRSFTGTVTITVTRAGGSNADPADISYSVRENSWVTFRPADFGNASRYTLGETLSYVRFTPPPSSEGTLFYNYRGFSDFDSMVNSTTSYYYGGNPALGGVSFVPTTTTPGQVDIGYTGYTSLGNTFEGTIHITVGDAVEGGQQQLPLHYTVFTGRTVSLSASDFNTACRNATGYDLTSVQFTRLPGVSQGTLRYTRGNSSAANNVTTSIRFYRTGTGSSANLIGNVYFQAGSSTGTVTIPFTGTNERGATFTDEVTIVVTPPTASEITYSGTTASPIRLSASQISSALSGAWNQSLSYITFTSLPSATAGHLYLGYSGVGTGTQVNTGTRYYASGTPGIDQISFVPRGRYNGQVSVGYTAASANGQSVSGRILFNISSTGSSSYFTDMAYHTWAAPSVDYLYQNQVTNGVTATQYGPNQRINRCDFVLMLCRAFKFSGSNGYSFADVPTNSYFSQAVATAKQLGIVSGDGNNFRPYGQVTRQDAMVMTYNALRAAGWNVGNASSSVLNQFTDSASVSSYARTAVSALVQMGAVNGDNGRLLPHNSITRAEAAVILHFVMTM